MKKNNGRLLMIAMLSLASGCSLLTDGNPLWVKLTQENTTGQAKTDANSANGKIANPPARTIRFDGHEIVLGEAEATVLEPERFVAILQPVVAQQRFRSAASLIEHHRETAERTLAERWATNPDDAVVRLIAEVLSRRSKQPKHNWNSLLKLAKERPKVAKPYQDARNKFATQLQTSDPSHEQAMQLQQLAQSVGHPLVTIDSLRLLGLRELVSERTAWAESLCRQAFEAATAAGHPLLAAELSLVVAEAARRGDQAQSASQAWAAAVAGHLAAVTQDQPVDVNFWLLAEHVRPEGKEWPNELISALSSHLQPVGCTSEGGTEMVLWACVAQAQFQREDTQAALVNFKKAENLVSGNNVQWLRIAQAKCLAAMGQGPAAAAILSTPATSSEPAIAAAGTAAMGSTKLQAGAYQQGAQLLNKALTQTTGANWGTKSQALADLALAQLIIGDTEPGLEALHAVQAQFAQSGDKLLLIRSLENELRLLEHEHRDQAASAIKQRISELERI